MIITTLPSQRQTSPQTQFDDGRHVDIHWVVDGEATIATWRRSFYDDTGQYSNQELNQLSDDKRKGEQSQRSSSGYEELNQVERQSSVPHHYTGIGSDQPRSRINPEGYMEPVQRPENGNREILEQFQQPSRTHHHSVWRSKSDSALYTSGQHRKELPRRPRSYGGDEDTNSPADRHSYLEIIG